MSARTPSCAVPGPQIKFHAAWAMAVGGMIGGGIYTLAGVVLGFAGPLAWLSLALGGLLALATARSYFLLTLETAKEGVPITLLLRKGRHRTASVTAWWLLLVYVLSTSVYAFTFAQYVGGALGLPPMAVALCGPGIIGLFVVVNLLGAREPARVQIAAVWIELVVLGAIAAIGFARWQPAHLVEGVPSPSLVGVVVGMAATFIAFEGFEMLFYDVRELRHPRNVLRRAVPAALVAVAVAYALVTVGASSLVGAGTLVEQKATALAVAGRAAAGPVGLVVVTVAACASAASAINATLFSVARLGRSAAELKLLPASLAVQNGRCCPTWGIVVIGLAAAVLASIATLEPLVQAASLAFLTLFAFVNALAFHDTRPRSVIALAATLASIGAALIVAWQLAGSYPMALGGFFGAWALSVVGWAVMAERRKVRHEPPPTQDPEVLAIEADLVVELVGLWERRRAT